MILNNLSKYSNAGLLIMRIGLGAMMVMHGYPKLAGGTETWIKVGGAMGVFGITFMPVVWGLLATCAEFFGGILVVLGLATRPACIAICITMAVAFIMHYTEKQDIMDGSNALELFFAYFGLLFVGAGKYSIDGK